MGSLVFGDSSNPLEDIKSIFYNDPDPLEAAVAWAKGVLQRAGLDSKKNPVSSIKELRKQEPALSLKTATYLVKKISVF